MMSRTFFDAACTFLAGSYRAEQAIADQLIHMVNERAVMAMDRVRSSGSTLGSGSTAVSSLQQPEGAESAWRFLAKAFVVAGPELSASDDRRFDPRDFSPPKACDSAVRHGHRSEAH